MQQQHLNLVGYAVAPGTISTQRVDFTIPIAISISVILCFCPILGIAALIIAGEQ